MKTKDRRIPKSISLPTSMVEWLESESRAKGISVSDLILGFITIMKLRESRAPQVEA